MTPWAQKPYQNSIAQIQKYCTQESRSKQIGLHHSQVWFWRSVVFNKGNILPVFVCDLREREDSERDRK